MAITKSEDPILVNLPNPAIAKGQIEGHINEFARPSNATKITDVKPLLTMASTANKIPSSAEAQ